MNTGQRILGLDIGRKKVGIAISDTGRQFARDLKKVSFSGLIDELHKLRTEYPDLGGIVIGLPLNMNGTEGKAAEDLKLIGADIGQILQMPIYWQDERLTSWEARQNLLEQGYKPNQIKELEDQMAAKAILQAFLNHLDHNR